MNAGIRCIFCGGNGTIVSFDFAGGMPIFWPCRLCKGTGQRLTTLTPFFEELDSLGVRIELEARFMESVANIGLQEMTRQMARDAILKYPITAKERLAAAFHRHFGEHRTLSEGYQSHEEHMRLHERWVNEPGRIMGVQPGLSRHEQGFAIDMHSPWFDNAGRHVSDIMGEPWHYEYNPTGRTLPRWKRWLLDIKLYWQERKYWREEGRR